MVSHNLNEQLMKIIVPRLFHYSVQGKRLLCMAEHFVWYLYMQLRQLDILCNLVAVDTYVTGPAKTDHL